MDEHLSAVSFDQRAEALAHAQSDIAKDLKAVRSRNQEGDATVAEDANGFWETLEGFQFEAGEIKAL